MKKIQIQRVSVFDIVITLVLGVVFVLLPESVWPEEIRSVSLHDSDLTMSDSDKMRKALQLVCNSQYQNMRDEVTANITMGIDSLIELTQNKQGRAATVFADMYRKIELSAGVAFTDRVNPGESIFKDADKALYKVKQNGRHGCDFY